jgi:CRP-like cAMP-binding protein
VNSLISKWKARFDGFESATEVLAEGLKRQRSFDSRQDLVGPDPSPDRFTLLTDGFAARYRLLNNGRRQITAIHVPGDLIDLDRGLTRQAHHGVISLSPGRVTIIEHDGLRQDRGPSSELLRFLWADSLIEAEIAREWLVAMGRRTAQGHLAHLLCELFVRLSVVGRATGASFPLPLTQVDLADTLGLSMVHVNRVLKRLRAESIIRLNDQTVSILDWPRLAHTAEFEVGYLGFRPEAISEILTRLGPVREAIAAVD